MVAARGINIKFMEDIYQDELRGYKRDTGSAAETMNATARTKAFSLLAEAART